MKQLNTLMTAAAVWLAAAPAALAASEQGDAGDVPASAQDLSGEVVPTLDGSLADGLDQDLYRVCLTGGGSFSATTVGGTSVDTQLFLFDGQGLGVYANDDSAGTRQSTLPADTPLTPAAGGQYLLAISPYNRDPQSPLGPIFPDRPSVVGATERGSGLALSTWSGRTGAPGAYTIVLTGTTACSASDTTPPAIDLRAPRDGEIVARGASVLVDYSCSDEGGSGLASCIGTVADGEPLDTGTAGVRAVTVRARDNAGNESEVTHSVTVADADAPTISLRSPLDGAVYLLGDEVLADYACADEPGGSGLLSCEGSVADGGRVDTTAVGEQSFTVEAVDLAGNTAAATSLYRVVFDFGFRGAVHGPPAVNELRAGRTLPVKFSLAGFHGLDVIADGYPQVAEVECGSGHQAEQGEPARVLGGLRYRRGRDRYRFLWRTERGWRGSCRQLLIKLADGTIQRADFHFKQQHHRRDAEDQADD